MQRGMLCCQACLEFLATPRRDAAQDGRWLQLKRPLFFLPLDSGRVEYILSARVEVGGHNRAEMNRSKAKRNEAAGEGQYLSGHVKIAHHRSTATRTTMHGLRSSLLSLGSADA